MENARGIRIPPGPGKAALLACALLVVLDLLLLRDAVIHRYAAVFAVGRAMDKQLYAEQHPPTVLIIGNSRVDNGVSPRILEAEWHAGISVFNFGIPGANTRALHGMMTRLAARGLLGPRGVRAVVLGLDESVLQADESLGYVTFFADRQSLWSNGQYRLWLGSWLPLWAYSDNLRQLREPEKALRFARATFRPLEPIGGAAWRHSGYRAGFAGGQNEEQAIRQGQQAQQPPDPLMLRYLDALLDLLQSHGVAVAIAFPPLQQRPSAYLDPTPAEPAYAHVREALARRQITMLDEPDPVPRASGYFVNAGHLNDQGASLYSRWLAQQLRNSWSWLKPDGHP